MINREYDQKITQWIEEHRQQIVDRWMELIRIPSVRGEAAPNAPFGVECARALHKAASYFEEEGFATQVEEGHRYALAEYGEGEKTIALYGHADVVPVGEGWLFTTPFEPVIREGSLIGRGANDNKNGIMAGLCILSILRDCGIKLNNRLRMFIGSNEESGMEDIKAFVQNEPMPDLSLVPDSLFPCCVGEKGSLGMWAECDTPLKAIRGFQGGQATNIVLDRVEVTLPADQALEAQLRAQIDGDPNYVLTVGEDAMCLVAIGVSKHASQPEGSVNAACLAAKVLRNCTALPESDRAAMATVEDLLSDPYGAGMGIQHEDPRFGKLTAANGMVAQENGKLRVSLNCRYGMAVPYEKTKEILEKAWAQRGWSIASIRGGNAFHTDENSPIPDLICQTYQDICGIRLEPYRMGGGTYSRYLKNSFAVGTLADHAGRTTPRLKYPAGHGDAHQRDEGIDIDGYLLGIRVLVHAVLACDAAL